MTASGRRELLALSLAFGPGSRTLDALLAVFPGPAAILEASPFAAAFLARLPERRLAPLADASRWLAAADRVAGACERAGIGIICNGDAAYPAALAAIHDPPQVLYLRGCPEALQPPCLAIVGTRRPTHAGLRLAWDAAFHAATCGWTVASGGAYGIDAAAHQGALDGNGRTVFVLAHGLDHLYPAAHRDLAEQALARGALLSEHPPGVRPRPAQFARRNRIVSGLSGSVLVIQAPLGSGALITASCALDQGRDVLVGDWPAEMPEGAGCRMLAADGAITFASASELFRGDVVPGAEGPPGELEPDLAAALRTLGGERLAAPVLAARLGWEERRAAVVLVRLELLGLVRSWEGALYAQAARKILPAPPVP